MITFLLGVATGTALVLTGLILQSCWLDYRYHAAMKRRYHR